MTSRASLDGFTLIELLITLAIGALLLGLAVPTFRDLGIRNQLANSINDIVSSVSYARSEAIRRGRPVSICSSTNGTTCGGTWNSGWIIFLNSDNDSPPAVDSGETVLKVYTAQPSGYALSSDAALAGGITYGSDGAASSTGIMTMCHNNETAGARALVLTRLRPRLAADSNGDRIPNRDDGANIASCTAPGGP